MPERWVLDLLDFEELGRRWTDGDLVFSWQCGYESRVQQEMEEASRNANIAADRVAPNETKSEPIEIEEFKKGCSGRDLIPGSTTQKK